MDRCKLDGHCAWRESDQVCSSSSSPSDICGLPIFHVFSVPSPAFRKICISRSDPRIHTSNLLLSFFCCFISIFYSKNIQKTLLNYFNMNAAACMQAGICLGPSIIGRNKQYMSTFFYTRSIYIIESFEAICFLFICYVTTCQIDTHMIKRVGRLAFINGIVLFLIPFLWGQFTAILISKRLGGRPAGVPPAEFHHVAIVQSTMFFQVVYGVLSNLKMLNTEPGRLALASMMVHDCLSWCFFMLNIALKNNTHSADKNHAYFLSAAQVRTYVPPSLYNYVS